MEAIESVGGVTSSGPLVPQQPMGATAELARARAALRETAGPNRWQAAQEEVARLQAQEHMPPLAAIQSVLGRLAAGWEPTPWR